MFQTIINIYKIDIEASLCEDGEVGKEEAKRVGDKLSWPLLLYCFIAFEVSSV